MNLILEADILKLPYVSFLAGLAFCLLGRKLLGVIVILFGFLLGYTWGSVFLADIIGRTIASSPWIPWGAHYRPLYRKGVSSGSARNSAHWNCSCGGDSCAHV